MLCLNFALSNVERSVCSPHSVVEQLQVLRCKYNHVDGFAEGEWVSYQDDRQAGLYIWGSLCQVLL